MYPQGVPFRPEKLLGIRAVGRGLVGHSNSGYGHLGLRSKLLKGDSIGSIIGFIYKGGYQTFRLWPIWALFAMVIL